MPEIWGDRWPNVSVMKVRQVAKLLNGSVFHSDGLRAVARLLLPAAHVHVVFGREVLEGRPCYAVG